MFFSVTNKNLNWEIMTKNLVTFKLLKDEMKLRMKNLNIMGGHRKIRFQRALQKTKIQGDKLAKQDGEGGGGL